MEQYPQELRDKPVPVIALIGASSKIHSAVASNLSFGAPEVNIHDATGDNGEKHKSVIIMSFLRGENIVKPKGFTAASTTPSTSHTEDSPGILKANWLYKHMRQVPSVLIFFFPEWGKVSKWKDKENEFCLLLENIK